MWYQLAAIRMNSRSYAWSLETLEDDCKYGVMCPGVPYPDISHMKHVPEFTEGQISKNWEQAIVNAESAVHVPESKAQIESAICMLRKGADYKTAAWEAGLTCQGLIQSVEYKRWANALCDGSGKDVNYGRPVSPGEVVCCDVCNRWVRPVSLFPDFSKPTYEQHKRS